MVLTVQDEIIKWGMVITVQDELIKWGMVIIVPGEIIKWGMVIQSKVNKPGIDDDLLTNIDDS